MNELTPETPIRIKTTAPGTLPGFHGLVPVGTETEIPAKLYSKHWMRDLEGEEMLELAQMDDLEEIKGIGPATVALLHDNGVTSLDQIASWTDEDVAAIDEQLELRGRITTEKWVEQANELTRE